MSERRWQDGALVDRKRRPLPWRRNDKTHRPGSAIHKQPVPSTPRASGTCSQSRLEVLPKMTQARLRSPPLRLPKRFRTNLPGHAAAAVGSVRTSLSMMLGARFAPDPSSDQSPWAGMNNLHTPLVAGCRSRHSHRPRVALNFRFTMASVIQPPDDQIKPATHTKTSICHGRGETHSVPSGPVSFFQIGQSALSLSRYQEHAAKPSARWGEATTMITAASPISRRPIRW